MAITNLPTLRQLRHLVALADHGHFGRAAEASHVTQSTLSASIKELEQVLGAQLVDRTKRRVTVTPLGQSVVAKASRLLQEAEDLVETARANQGPLSGPLQLGVIPTIGPFLLPRALPALRRRYPGLKLYLTEDLTERLLEQLNAGKLDVALIALPYDTPGFEHASIGEDAFAVALPESHKLAKLDRIDPERIDEEPLLLLRDGHCLREHALAACRLSGRGQTDTFQATSLYTLVQMVENGLGVTLLPKIALDAGILKGTHVVTRPIAGKSQARDLALVWRKGSARRTDFELMAGLLHQALVGGKAGKG
jgi:LysR family transcriptional regulator, hydrogen peroxide-inducible genes activator